MNQNQNQAPDSSINVLALGLRRLLNLPAPQPDPIQVYHGDDMIDVDGPSVTDTGKRFEPRMLKDLALTKLICSEEIDYCEDLVKEICQPLIIPEYIQAYPHVHGKFKYDIEIYDSFDDYTAIVRFMEMFKAFMDPNDDCLDIAVPLRISLWRFKEFSNLMKFFREDWEFFLFVLLRMSLKKDPNFVKDLTKEGIEPNPGPTLMTSSERLIVEGANWFETPFCPEIMLRFIPVNKYIVLDVRSDMHVCVEFVEDFDWELVRVFVKKMTKILYNLTTMDYDRECRHIAGSWNDRNIVKKTYKFPRLLFFYLMKLADINFEGKDILDALRALLTQHGVEMNPGPAMLNGDTRRDSKTHRSLERTKFENLPDFHEKKLQQKHKRHVRALDAEKRAFLRKRADGDFSDHEFDDFIKPEGLSVDLKMFRGLSAEVKFDLFTDLFKHLKSILNPSRIDEKYLMGHLTTLIIVLRSDDWMVRVAALIANWPNLGDKTTGVYTVLVLLDSLANWWRRGDVNSPWYRKEDVPEEVRTQALSDVSEHFDISSFGPIQGIGALVLSVVSLFLLRQIPGKGDFDSFMKRCGVVGYGAKGMESIYGYSKMFMDSAVVFCEEKLLGESPTMLTSIESRLTKLCAEIKQAASIENQSKLMTSRVQVDHVDTLFRRSLDMLETLRLGGLAPQKQAFAGFFLVIRELHKKASVSPISGRGFRQQPKFFQLTGNPGVGKTRLAWILSIDFLRELNLTKEQLRDYASYIYFRKTGEKYWTNYNAEMHRICVCDDASQLFEEHSEGVPFFAEIIHLANNAECPLSVAEVDLKKFARFNSEVIIATDNNKNPNLSNILRDPAAFRRRIDMQIDVKVKPEFGEKYQDGGRTWFRLKRELAL